MAQANQRLQDLVASSNKIYIFELFAAAAAVSQLRGRLWRRKVILFVDNGAASAALTKGISRNWAAFTLVFSLRAIAAQYDIAICSGRVPMQVNPAGLPSRDGQLSFTTEPSEDLASLDELLPICDLSWMLFQRTD